MKSCDQVYNALSQRADERGYCRFNLDALALETSLSRSTVKRAIDELEASKRLRRKSRGGPTGGLLVRLESGSKSGSNPVQNEPDSLASHNAFDLKNPDRRAFLTSSPQATESGSPSTSGRGPAYREARPHERPESGANLLYANDTLNGQWRRIHATCWMAPNGDAVSIRSMTPELRLRLRVDLNDDGTPCLEAIRAIRSILE